MYLYNIMCVLTYLCLIFFYVTRRCNTKVGNLPIFVVNFSSDIVEIEFYVPIKLHNYSIGNRNFFSKEFNNSAILNKNADQQFLLFKYKAKLHFFFYVKGKLYGFMRI